MISNYFLQCRFVTKYRHSDGKLNVKITDDNVVSNNYNTDVDILPKDCKCCLPPNNGNLNR